MNAIISKDGKTAHVQLPVGRRQLAGALAYLGEYHANEYDLAYNVETNDGIKVSLDCRGEIENALAKVFPVGMRFHTLNDTLALMNNLPYQNRLEVENAIKTNGLESYEQLDSILTNAYPQSVTTKYYCPLTIQVHRRDFWGETDEEGYEEDAMFAARHQKQIEEKMLEYMAYDECNMAEYFHGNNGVSEKLRSADWGFENRSGELYGCITVQTAGNLTLEEEQDLKDCYLKKKRLFFGTKRKIRLRFLRTIRRSSTVFTKPKKKHPNTIISNRQINTVLYMRSCQRICFVSRLPYP